MKKPLWGKLGLGMIMALCISGSWAETTADPKPTYKEITRSKAWLVGERHFAGSEKQYFATTPQANDPGKGSTFFSLVCIHSKPDQLLVLVESKEMLTETNVLFKVQFGKEERQGTLPLRKFSDKDRNLHAVIPTTSPMLADLKRADPYFAIGYKKDGKEIIHGYLSAGSTNAINTLLKVCKAG